MSFLSWLQNFCSTLTPQRGQGKPSRRRSLQAASRRLNLEVLEDRLALSLNLVGHLPGSQLPWEVEPAQTPPVLADVTSDGIPDLIKIGGQFDVSVQPGRGDGTFGDPVYSDAPNGQQLALADFNGDSQLDILMLDELVWDGVNNFGVVLLGRGNGTFEWARLPGGDQSINLNLDRTWSFGAGDIDGDGRPDAAVAGIDYGGEPVVAELLNDGYWNWGPYVFFSDATVKEGNTGTASANFTLTLAHPSNVDLTFHYHTEDDGSATAGTDYQAASGTLTIPAGQTTGTITVLVNGDTLPEPNEYFDVYLSSPTNADLTMGYATGAIVDDEPRVSIGDLIVTEGNPGTKTANFTVTLDAPSTDAITAVYATADGTATAGSDYQATSGSLTFAPGETSKTISVLVNGDRLAEPNESFFVNLSNPSNAFIADGQGQGAVLDDEPRVSIDDVTKKEGRKGTTLFTFTVKLSAAYDQSVTMSFKTVDGTAKTSDADYVSKTGTLTFAPGETTKTITIEVKGDSNKESDETFYLDLFGLSSNALFTKNRGIGKILNDD